MRARRTRRRRDAGRAALAVMGLGLGASTASAEVPEWLRGDLTISAGFDYSTGDYGETIDTDIWYAPVTVAYFFDHLLATPTRRDALELRLTVPFVHIQGPEDVLPGEGGGAGGTQLRVDSGVADTLLRGSYFFFPPSESAWPAIEASAQLTIPTASSDQNLGTGAYAGTFRVDLFKGYGRVTPFVSGGYRVIEKVEDRDLVNTWRAAAGLTLRASRWLSGGVAYDWRQSSLRRGDIHEISPYATFRLPRGLRIGPYAVFGLSTNSPRYSLGLQIRTTLGIR